MIPKEFYRLLVYRKQGEFNLGGLNTKFIFSVPEARSSQIKVSESSVSSQASLLALQMASLTPCPHMVFPLCVHVPGSMSSSPFVRTLVTLDLSPAKQPHSTLITSLKILSPSSHILRSFGWRFPHMNLGKYRHNEAHISQVLSLIQWRHCFKFFLPLCG